MKQTITFTYYHTDIAGNTSDETEYDLPAKFEICPSCDGCGTDRGRSVECDGGGFTASEWAEQDEEFKEQYLSGFYDRQCETCKGHTGRILVVDEERCDPKILKLFHEHCQSEREFAAERAAELKYGY
jgi:RecJ-like exonuclease